MVRTPAQALAWANGVTRGYGGWCLKFVRLAYGVAAKEPSAKAAWANSRKRHTSLANAPEGAPVFMSHPKSKYGHVALLVREGGKDHIRTTNSSTNRIHTDPISLWESWGYRVLGWAEDLNGVKVASPVRRSAPVKPAGGVLRRGQRGSRVRRLQEGLNRVFPAYSRLVVDESFGPKTEAVVKEFQRRAGLVQDGFVGPLTQAALARYGIRV